VTTAEDLALVAVGLSLVSIGVFAYLVFMAMALIERAEKRHRDERTMLVNRIQRPDLVPPSPDALRRNQDEADRKERLRAQLRSVGTVRHDVPPE
jgi:hypothetical protein